MRLEYSIEEFSALGGERTHSTTFKTIGNHVRIKHLVSGWFSGKGRRKIVPKMFEINRNIRDVVESDLCFSILL